MLWRRGRRITDRSELREELKRRCQPYLRPGESVRHVFGAEVGMLPGFARSTAWLSPLAVSLARRHYRLVCVTETAIVILRSSRDWMPEGVVAELPRGVRLGPLSESWGGDSLEEAWVSLEGLGGGLYVPPMFVQDVAAADAELHASR